VNQFTFICVFLLFLDHQLLQSLPFAYATNSHYNNHQQTHIINQQSTPENQRE